MPNSRQRAVSPCCSEEVSIITVVTLKRPSSRMRRTKVKPSISGICASFVMNGISGDHRRYLALGGQGFILGDSGLNYGLEKIVETYYTAHLWRGVSIAADYQHVQDPGYNRDRGPASVVSFRIHIEDAIPFDRFQK